MKKICLVALLLVFAAVSYAQEVTKFLGIPVDGTKAEMIEKLKAKGFRSNSLDKEILEGEFNGKKVQLHIVTNNNKVYRIMVADANAVDEGQIKIRYNNLCRQFENNAKYIAMVENQIIPEDENISYEMVVHNKEYQAGFYQQEENAVDNCIKRVQQHLLSKYTEEQLNNPTEEISKEIAQEIISESVMAFENSYKRMVWFCISQNLGKYYIMMYYDNGYNQANGEDL